MLTRTHKINSLNFLVKVLSIVFILSFNRSWGQASLPISRTAWVATPTGWTDFGTSNYGTSTACSGNDAGQLNSTGDYYMVFYNSAASNLSFSVKSTTVYGAGIFDVQESVDGVTWTVVQSNIAITNGASCVAYNLTLLCTSRYVRFYYTSRVANIVFDDVSITLGTCTACTVPTITLAPVSQTVCTNATSTFSVASSATTPTYQWKMSSSATGPWINVVNGTPTGVTYTTGATSPSLTAIGTATALYYYQCIVTENGICTVISNTVSLTISDPVSITLQPTNKTICSSKNTTYVVNATGSPISYQWQVNSGAGFSNIANGVVYSGALTTTLTLTGVPVSMNTYSYQCVLTVPGCSTATTSIATLSVNATPPFPPVPVPLANPACENTYLTAVTSTVSGVTWYWESNSANGNSTSLPSSVNYYVGTSDDYYIGARDNVNGCFALTGVSVTINLDPVVSVQPVDKSICSGANTSFAITAINATSYQWQVDNGGGFVNCSAAPYSTFTTNALTITNATGAINGYKYRCLVNGNSPCASVFSNYGTLTITGAAAPTTAASVPNTSSIGCNAFKLSWTIGNGSNRLVVVSSSAVAGNPTTGVSYVANTVFGSGGTIAAGVYVVYNGTGSSVFVTGLSASTTYYYKIFEFNGCGYNYLTSGTVPNGNVVTTSCTFPAGITGVYIDACGSSTCPNEGSNELIWGTTGSYGMAVNNNGPTLHYNSTTAPTTTYISTYAQNASNITALNTAVGACGTTTFVDPNTQGYIPPLSKFLVANNCMCNPSAYDFSGLCGSGPIYVVFGTNTQWPCNTSGGIFGNYSAGGGVRYFDLDMNSWGTALDPIYNYTIGSLTGSDGAIILTNPVGGAATTYSNSACKVPTVILPIELLDFYATKNNKVNDIVWKVAQEEHILYYTVEKSNDAVNFTQMATVYANSEMQIKSYSVIDDEPFNDITYYRLSTKETSGLTKYYNIISVDEKDTKWHYTHYQTESNLVIEFKNSLPKNSTVNLYDLSGKAIVTGNISQSQTTINTQSLASGIYFVQIVTPYKIENFKIIISK